MSQRENGSERERIVVIGNRYGLHARPAAEFVKLSSRFKAKVTVEKDGLEVNGKSIMGVMMLAAECGSTLRIRAVGEDATEALEALATLVSNHFGETESDYEVEN
jgi:phosphocarrier protein HPr